MNRRRRKAPREKDLTSRLYSGDLDEDRVASQQRFTDRSKHAEQNKIEKTALLRDADGQQAADIDTLPIGQVVQIFSLYSTVQHASGTRLCVVRKTLNKLSETSIAVGDRVRFRDSGIVDESGREAVIEAILPRHTVLTRTDSFLSHQQHPIVANADQVLIVASLVQPQVKWGLIDRVLVSACSGGLTPIICLNKIDLAESSAQARREFAAAQEVLAHYQKLGMATVQTCALFKKNVDQVAALLKDKTTVLAGHSGAGKSTMIAAIQPGLDIRTGEVSVYTDKGRHTTTSTRFYDLDIGARVIDTPGVKLFGLWGVTADNLIDFYPDIADDSAPAWRKQSYQRILDSLSGRMRD